MLPVTVNCAVIWSEMAYARVRVGLPLSIAAILLWSDRHMYGIRYGNSYGLICGIQEPVVPPWSHWPITSGWELAQVNFMLDISKKLTLHHNPSNRHKQAHVPSSLKTPGKQAAHKSTKRAWLCKGFVTLTRQSLHQQNALRHPHVPAARLCIYIHSCISTLQDKGLMHR